MWGQASTIPGGRWRAGPGAPEGGAPGESHLRGRAFRGLAFALATLFPLASAPALAQSEANPSPIDPPSLVGQLTRVSGTVSFHTTGETTWQPADPNYPITSGNSLWTQPSSTASVVFGANRVAMDQATELDIGTLDQHRFVATVPQGSVFVHMRDMQPGDEVVLETPRGTVTIGQNGVYEVAAGDQATPTRVTALQGAAQVYGSGVSSMVQQGQTATITGSSPFTASLGPAQQDPFLASQLPQTPPPPQAGPAPPPVVAQMTGGDELANTGTWAQSPQYGQVWYPPVAPGWVPYRDGHWAWVAPWGWTWVDDAPWGFAPFHYGRWVEVGPRWGWIPVLPGVVVVAPPVYAPAMVAFFGIGVGVGAFIGFGHPVGWCPLGPDEPYHPWYHTSRNYIRNVNVVNVRNVNNINVTNVYNTTTINKFVNRNAVTVVPSQVMSSSRPVGRNLEHVTPASFVTARPYTSAPVRPTAATAGLTPAVAHQFGMAPVTPQRIAPGPAVRPTQVGAPVALRPKGGAPVMHPLITSPEAPRPPTPRPAVNQVPPPARPETTRPQTTRPTTPAPQPPRAPAPAPAPGRVEAPRGPEPQVRPAPAPHQGAPGPAIVPHTQGTLPTLRPSPSQQPRPESLPQRNNAPTPRPETQPQRSTLPSQQRPEAQPQRTSVPVPPRPEPQPQRYTPPTPPRPEVQPQRTTPPAQPRPEAQPQRTSVPVPPRPEPQPQHYTPPPQPRPQPQPQPQPQRYTPPPQQHYTPPPQQHYSPPPQQHYNPPPQQHSNPPPRPEPSSCHPGQRCG